MEGFFRVKQRHPWNFRGRALLGFLLACFLAPSAAHACACSKAPPGVCPGLQKDDVVFTGTVIDIQPAAADASNASAAAPASDAASSAQAAATAEAPITRYRFRIDERFAGPDQPEIDVFSGGDDGDCGYIFKKGKQYIVFTQQEGDGRLFSTICNGTRPASEGRALIPQLRAMEKGERVASVFGVIRRADPPLLEPTDDPEDPLAHVPLKLRSKIDRFSTATDGSGVYSFYDVHAGRYNLTAKLPSRLELTEKTLSGGLPPVEIPNGACYEFNIVGLPVGKIEGSVLGPDGKPLHLASLELYRADRYEDSRPGLWGFQGDKGAFEFDHIGPGDYLLVFNRTNRLDPNTPYPRSFYPGSPNSSGAKMIHLKDGQDLKKVDIILNGGYPTRDVRVQLKWQDGRLPGDVYVTAKASEGENPAARKIGDGLYEFTLLQIATYTFTAGEDPDPGHPGMRAGKQACNVPAHIDTPPVEVSGGDASAEEIALTFPSVSCEKD